MRCRLRLTHTLPKDKQASCLSQLQHKDFSSKEYTIERLNAFAKVHGVVCMPDFSSIAHFPYTADSTLRNDAHAALQPSLQFKAILRALALYMQSIYHRLSVEDAWESGLI